MKHFLLFTTMLFASGIIQGQSPKKGIAYGQHSVEDMQVLSDGVSWWYNWYHRPEDAVVNAFEGIGVEFVPMTWNGAFDENALRAFLDDHPDVHYLLGFNEPNFVSQANMTPQQAASVWPKLESIAHDYNLKLVAPAVNYCDVCVDIPGNDDSNPTAWLDAFFSACPECQVDYIAAHWYACDVGALDWYISQFNKYNLPLWITEIACWEGNPNLVQQKSYLIGAVDLMERDSRVYRYAWFSGRSNGPFNSLLAPASGELTELGELYVNFNPIHDTSLYVSVPARIEAENYSRAQGIFVQATEDVDGVANIGWTDPNDWMEYRIDVAEAGAYPLKLRVAGTGTGRVSVALDGITQTTLTILPTGGWQTWRTVPFSITLPEGRHALRISVQEAGFNLNWLQIGSDIMVSTAQPEHQHPYTIYPQPISGNTVNIYFHAATPNAFTAELLSPDGRLITSKTFSPGSDINTFELPRNIPSGIYIMRLTTAQGRFSSKLVLN